MESTGQRSSLKPNQHQKPITWLHYPQCVTSQCLIHSNNRNDRLFNSSPLSAAYRRHWTRSALVQIMICRLFGATPLPEPMLTYCQLETLSNKLNEIWIKIQNFSFKKMHRKASSTKGRPFFSRGYELIIIGQLSHYIVACFLKLCNPHKGN